MSNEDAVDLIQDVPNPNQVLLRTKNTLKLLKLVEPSDG